jgi:multimeric flavodoxin WrbA
MAAVIMGISGSPVVESNTDRAVREILDHSGLDYDFIKLSNLHIEPCRACQGCTESNSCTIQDNGRVLAEKFAQVKGFVLGGYTSYGSLDSRTKMFMERMYCLRHVRSRNKGKVGVVVLTTAGEHDEHADLARKQAEYWMQEEGIRNLGTLVLHGSGPCVRCGNEQCITQNNRVPGTAPLVDAAGFELLKLEPTAMTRAAELGMLLRDAVQETAAASR